MMIPLLISNINRSITIGGNTRVVHIKNWPFLSISVKPFTDVKIFFSICMQMKLIFAKERVCTWPHPETEIFLHLKNGLIALSKKSGREDID